MIVTLSECLWARLGTGDGDAVVEWFFHDQRIKALPMTGPADEYSLGYLRRVGEIAEREYRGQSVSKVA